MTDNATVSRLAELRDAVRRGDLDIDEFYQAFEIAINEAPWEGRQRPAELNELVNRVELVRFGLRPEHQREAAARVAEDAIRLFS